MAMTQEADTSGRKRGPVPRIATVLCQQCGEPFQMPAGELEKRGRRYCSTKCQAKGQQKKAPSKDELSALYLDRRISMNSLSEMFGVSDVTIRRWLNGYEIPVRNISASVSIAQTGVVHSLQWNQAISRAHLARGSWQGADHPNFRDPGKWKSRRSKGGKRADLGGLFLRSTWEANVARYLNWLVQQEVIVRWEYEPEHFEFKAIKRGSRFYTPDFRITYSDGAIVYWEIKGWMDQKSRTKLNRMRIYHPAVKIIVIDRNQYAAIAKKMKGLLPTWENGSGDSGWQTPKGSLI
jgi:hypothetical protein